MRTHGLVFIKQQQHKMERGISSGISWRHVLVTGKCCLDMGRKPAFTSRPSIELASLFFIPFLSHQRTAWFKWTEVFGNEMFIPVQNTVSLRTTIISHFWSAPHLAFRKFPLCLVLSSQSWFCYSIFSLLALDIWTRCQISITSYNA